jgi:uncharacterized protein involved in exopolysaccharide biosynthesis
VTPEIEQPEIISRALPEMDEVSEGSRRDERAIIIARLLWNERRFVGKVAVWGTLMFLVVALLMPATYESQTQLMPPDQHSSGALSMMAMMGQGGGSAANLGGAASMAADLLGLRNSGALFISILRSDTVEDRLIDRFDLRRVYWVSTYRAARRKLASETSIDEDHKSGVIDIVVTDRDRERAAALANAYVQELDHMVTDLNTSAAHRERVFLEERLKAVKKELDASSKAFSEFASKNTAIDISYQGKAMVEAAATLQGELMAAQSELRALEQIYTPSNVRVRSLQARITELRRQLQKLGGSGSDDSSGSGTDQMYPSIRQLPMLGVPYYNLYRDLKINETILEVLTKEYEIAKVEEAKEVPSVKVIDIAGAAERRSGPPRKLITLAGTLLSFGFAAVCLFCREAWRKTAPQDPRKQLLADIGTTIGEKIRRYTGTVRSRLDRNRLWRRFRSNRAGISSHDESLE